jgi:hypothetical protein
LTKNFIGIKRITVGLPFSELQIPVVTDTVSTMMDDSDKENVAVQGNALNVLHC